VLCDEVDRYPVSAGSEGDPILLAKKRSVTFWNRKIVLASTPTIKDQSRIESAYNDSDQREYYVPCQDYITFWGLGSSENFLWGLEFRSSFGTQSCCGIFKKYRMRVGPTHSCQNGV
jgi:hypothetical protein